MEENKYNIILDDKTVSTVKNILTQIRLLDDKLKLILQTVVNTRYPDSEDRYELSEDGTRLLICTDKEIK